MSTHNDELYIREAIDSTLAQTFRDFELVVVNDGSTDATAVVLRSYHDPRMRVIENGTNIGLTRSLKLGVALARGKYVARMDSDDVSLPHRLDSQTAYLDAHPVVGAIGSSYINVEADGGASCVVHVPTRNIDIQRLLEYRNPLCHSTLVFRRSSLAAVSGYDEEFELAQDWDLLLRIAGRYELAALPEPLVHRRRSSGSLSQSRRADQLRFGRLAIERALSRRLRGRGTTASSGRFHWFLACDDFAHGRTQAARSHLAHVVSSGILREEIDDMLEALVYRAFDVCRVAQATPGSVVDAGPGLAYLRTVFENLPSRGAQGLRRSRRRALAWLQIVTAFHNRRVGDTSRAWRSCLRGFLYDPRWLRDAGVVSVFVRSVVSSSS